VSIKEDEWELVGDWMWNSRNFYNGLSVLPYSNHTYKQAPYEDCTKEEYERLLATLKNVDLTKVIELQDNTNLSGELACTNGSCEVI
jgi:ribonucleoside-diphosphate reductase alpha chain